MIQIQEQHNKINEIKIEKRSVKTMKFIKFQHEGHSINLIK